MPELGWIIYIASRRAKPAADATCHLTTTWIASCWVPFHSMHAYGVWWCGVHPSVIYPVQYYYKYKGIEARLD
jgi:hypothetical protein